MFMKSTFGQKLIIQSNMRLTEYIDFITRKDLGLAGAAKPNDYTHLTTFTEIKRARYLYQCKLKGKNPVK